MLAMMEAMLAWSLSRDQWENKSELSPGAQTLRAVLREDFIRPGDGTAAGPS